MVVVPLDPPASQTTSNSMAGESKADATRRYNRVLVQIRLRSKLLWETAKSFDSVREDIIQTVGASPLVPPIARL